MEYKFKVGDKIKITDTANPYFYGESGVVVDIDPYDTEAPYLIFVSYSITFWCEENDLELIPLTPKAMLKTGMAVELADGRLAMVYENAQNELFFINQGGSIKVAEYDENLANTNSEWNISKIYGFRHSNHYLNEVSTNRRYLLWERPVEVEEMTLEQVCKELGREIKIVKC